MTARSGPLLTLALLATVLPACGVGGRGEPLPDVSAPPTISLSSQAFADGGPLPAQYTCDGMGIAPRLSWTESERAEEFVLIMTDPDAPTGTFVHWVVYAIPSNSDSIGEGQGPAGSVQGRNDLDQIGYAAPCPPSGDDPHRYIFTIYGLSEARTLNLRPGAEAGDVLEVIRCCVQAVGKLMATYRR